MEQPPPIPPMLPQQEGTITWGGCFVSVRGRVVPKYLFATTSMDVYLDEQCILQTGGKLSPASSCTATFDRGGVNHTVTLSWGVAVAFAFPYQLYIDGALVKSSKVRADNWYLALIPALLIGTVMGVLGYHFSHRLFHGISR